MIKKYFLGFTIAELIVAMAVIGSVAALTLPMVMSNHQNKVLQITFQKAYRDLENNLEELHANDYRKSFYQSKLASDGGISEFFENYYNVSQKCYDSPQPCFAVNYAKISDGTEEAFTCENGKSAQMKDNTAICIIPTSPAQEAIEADPTTGQEAQEDKEATPAKVYIDVNGNELPNIGGRDMFEFQIDKFSIEDTEDTASCTTTTTGKGCLHRLINDNWKVKY